MFSDFNFEARFGILPSFYIFKASYFYYFHICIFDLPRHSQNLEIAHAVNFSKSIFLGQIRNQRPKRQNSGWGGDRFAEKNGVQNVA